MATRKPYPSDVSDEEWAFVAPYVALVREDAPRRNHDPARGVQRTEVDRAHRLCLALYATRSSAVGSHIPADEEVTLCGCIRSDGPRFAHTPLAPFGRQSVRA